MSTLHEKVQAQKWALDSKPTQPFHRHLIGPTELEALLKMAEQLQPKPQPARLTGAGYLDEPE